ncbi:MAG: alpha/beta hydrolase [Thermocrispum sp.]
MDVLTYGDLPDHVVDVWPHRGETAVVVVHGGFWRAQYDRTHTYPLCAALATEGFLVAAIEYRRTGRPGGGWPGTFDDVALAVDRLPELLGVSRLVLLGHSAGGQLAVWAASRHRQPAGSPWRRCDAGEVAGVVSLAGICDLAAAAAADLNDGAVGDLLGGRITGEKLALADPMRLTGGGVPTVLLHGDCDGAVPLEQSAAYAEAARAAGDPVTLRVLPGVGHFAVIKPGSAGWPAVVAAVAELSSR